MNNNAKEEQFFEPIDIKSKGHIATDPDLIAEFNNKNGDLELVCQDNSIIHCHACVLVYQSNIIRTLLKHAGCRRSVECKKYTSSTMTKLLQMMYSIKVSFKCRNEMFEVLFAANYYNVNWLSTLIQSAIKLHCTRDTDQQTNANNCRDALLVLQENISYSAEKPSPGYEPFDPSIQPLTNILFRHLVNYAVEGVAPVDIDILAIVNSIYDYLDKDINSKRVEDKGPITNLLALCYDEENMQRSDIFNAIIRRDAVLTKHLSDLLRQELINLKEKLKTTTAELRAEQGLGCTERRRMSSPYYRHFDNSPPRRRWGAASPTYD